MTASVSWGTQLAEACRLYARRPDSSSDAFDTAIISFALGYRYFLISALLSSQIAIFLNLISKLQCLFSTNIIHRRCVFTAEEICDRHVVISLSLKLPIDIF